MFLKAEGGCTDNFALLAKLNFFPGYLPVPVVKGSKRVSVVIQYLSFVQKKHSLWEGGKTVPQTVLLLIQFLCQILHKQVLDGRD